MTVMVSAGHGGSGRFCWEDDSASVTWVGQKRRRKEESSSSSGHRLLESIPRSCRVYGDFGSGSSEQAEPSSALREKENMTSHGGEEDLLDLWSDEEFSSLEQLLFKEGFPMAEPSNDGDDHSGVSGAQGNNALVCDQQSAQTTTVATTLAQGDSNGTLESLTALNLKPEKSIYMLKKAEAMLREGQVDRQTCKTLGLRKFKATSEPFGVLRIGRYEVRTRYADHLIAKWYYTNKRLNWEILENGLKKKIEISWPDISAMRVEYGGHVEILEIELYKPPHFYCETEVRPRKHTSWKLSSDFTYGQACTYRRHHLEFPQGTLGKNMKPLFLLDSRLRELTRKPFPSSQSPFFVDYIADSMQPTPPLINSELIQLHNHLYHQLPPNHSRVPTSLANDELMALIQQYKRRYVNHQMPSLENSLASQVSDYGYASPPSLPRNGMIFNGQFMGHLPGEQLVRPLSCSPGKVTRGTSHVPEGYDHNSNPNPMMASKEPWYMSAGMNVARHTDPWNDEGIFNQDMGHHHSRLASLPNAMGIDVPPSSIYYPIANDHAGWRSHEGYDSNNELVSDHDHNHQNHNSNRTNMMMASKEPSYTTAGMNVARHADPWNDRGFFNQDMGHCLGPALWSNPTGMDVTSSSSYYPIMNDRDSQGSHEGYNSNNEPCMNDTNPYRAHAHDGLIYPELGSNNDRDHQDHQYMADYNTANLLPNEHMAGDDEVRMGSCFWGVKPPHFMP